MWAPTKNNYDSGLQLKNDNNGWVISIIAASKLNSLITNRQNFSKSGSTNFKLQLLLVINCIMPFCTTLGDIIISL